MIRPKHLEDRLDCFYRFDPHDTVCMKWCQLNIRCAITQDQCEQIEIMEDLIGLAAEPWGLQYVSPYTIKPQLDERGN